MGLKNVFFPQYSVTPKFPYSSGFEMGALGKMLIIFGIVIIAIGLLLVLGEKIPWLGKLPGDILVKRDEFSFYFPITTCILISIILSLLFWIFRK